MAFLSYAMNNTWMMDYMFNSWHSIHFLIIVLLSSLGFHTCVFNMQASPYTLDILIMHNSHSGFIVLRLYCLCDFIVHAFTFSLSVIMHDALVPSESLVSIMLESSSLYNFTMRDFVDYLYFIDCDFYVLMRGELYEVYLNNSYLDLLRVFKTICMKKSISL